MSESNTTDKAMTDIHQDEDESAEIGMIELPTNQSTSDELRCEDCGPIRPALTIVCPECGKLAEGVEIA